MILPEWMPILRRSFPPDSLRAGKTFKLSLSSRAMMAISRACSTPLCSGRPLATMCVSWTVSTLYTSYFWIISSNVLRENNNQINCTVVYIYTFRKYNWLYSYDCNEMKWNEMNVVLGHLCAHIGQTGPGEPPENSKMNEMTLPSRYNIRNSNPGGLRPSSLPLGHGGSPQYWIFTSEQVRSYGCSEVILNEQCLQAGNVIGNEMST